MNKKEENKESFADRHPKWNLFLGFIMLIALFCLGIYVIKDFINLMTNSIKWLVDTVSKMDAVIIVALITGAVSILGVVLSSIIAKSLEYRRVRREYLTQKRERPYGEFIEMVYKIQQGSKEGHEYPHEEMIQDMLKFSKELTLWGSPKVVNNWVLFKENGTKADAGIDNLFLIEKMMNDMRKDLGLPRVKKGNLLAFFINDIKEAMKKKNK